jgi:hypothetical protein
MSQAGRNVFNSGPGGFVQTLTSNDAVAVGPTAGNINVVGGNNITGTGNAGTSTITLSVTGTTNHSLLLGNATGSINNLGVATNGQLPIGSTGADPVLSTLTAGTGITITNGAGSITIAAAGGTVIETIHTQDGNNVTPTAGVINLSGGNSLTTTGTAGPNTATISLTGITQYNVQTGGASNALNNVAPSATSGVPLISQGAASQPTFGTAVVAGGGTGNISFNTTGVVISGATSTTALTAVTLTDGQLAIGSSIGNPAASTITAGPGISITNGHNSITISNTGAGFTWHDVTGGSATLAAENGYIADSGSLTTFTMPTNNVFGDTIKIVGKGAGGWKIVYGAGQNIIFGSSASTATTGNIASTNANDCVELVCTTSSVTAPIFTVVNAVGNISIT